MRLASYYNMRIGATDRLTGKAHTSEEAKPVILERMRDALREGRAFRVNEKGYTTYAVDRALFVEQTRPVGEKLAIEDVTFTPWKHGGETFLQGFHVFEIEERD